MKKDCLISKTIKIINLLSKEYPVPKIALEYTTPFELLVSTILSAQCTDERVNKITPGLFKKYPDIKDFASADIKELEQSIRSTGFYHNKAKNIVSSAKLILEKYDGKVPRSMKEMLTLPGVARKTANIVLGSGYNIIVGIAVDTHVRRLSQKIGLSKNDDPNKIEQDLIKIVPKKDWLNFNHLIINHGRKVCNARKPQCNICIISKLCISSLQ